MSSKTWDKTYTTAKGFRYWPCEELVRFAGGRGFKLGLEVLEVGCGNGANLWFLGKYTNAIGMDWSGDALWHAKELCQQNDVLSSVAFREGNILAVGSSVNAEFDGVVDCMTSQHVAWGSHAAAYKNYWWWTKPGGWLFLYHLDNQTSGAGCFYDHPNGISLFPDVGQICCPDQKHLAEVVQAQGWDINSVRRMTRGYDDGRVASYTVIEATRCA